MTPPADPLFDLRDRVVIVTGGLGRLGGQYARALVSRGAKVVVLDRTVPQSEDNADASLLYVAGDVTSRSSLEDCLALVQRRFGAPHGLINNAAIDAPPDAPAEENGPFEDYPERSWDRVMEVNAKGVFLCCQVFGSAMANEGRGSIINIGSIYGLVSPDQRIYGYRRAEGEPFFKPIAYSASKSALLNMTRYLATYWAERHVRVNTLTLAGVFAGQDDTFLKNYCARLPIGRMATEAEYDGPIVFLLSEASRYMTGANLVVDGGWTAW